MSIFLLTNVFVCAIMDKNICNFWLRCGAYQYAVFYDGYRDLRKGSIAEALCGYPPAHGWAAAKYVADCHFCEALP